MNIFFNMPLLVAYTLFIIDHDS